MLPRTFADKKKAILEQLNAPDDLYQDASPKGTIDAGVRTLLDQINEIGTLVTTSSCAGRMSVFVGGRSKPNINVPDGKGREDAAQPSSLSGKGGGKWAFISHEPVEAPDSAKQDGNHFHRLFDMLPYSEKKPITIDRYPLIHFKFEAMILHIMTASLQDAQHVLSAALDAGFRESGAVSLESLPVVAVRSTGLMLDSVLGYQTEDGELMSVVSEAYLHSLVHLSNERFQTNAQRIERFRSGILSRFATPKLNTVSHLSESSEQRRERKRHEGLLRQQQLSQTKSESPDSGEYDYEEAVVALP